MKFVMYPHGGSGNHGCEAIVRSTAALCRNDLVLFSNDIEEDRQAGLQDVCVLEMAEKPICTRSLGYAKAVVQAKVLGNKDAYDELVFRHIMKRAKQADYFLSIGGDNYCYGHQSFIYLVNRMLDRAGVKRVLWGASVEPQAVDGRMMADLKGYYKIWARESLTCEALVEKGLKQTFLLPDPAFVLGKRYLPLPEGFVEGNTVGINVSPMIIGYEQNQGVTLQNYVKLIQYIIDCTEMQIALIPHVVWSHNDDREPLKRLYEMFKETGRVVMIGDHNAEELKGYIARCRFMVVARTHASIAAYSTNVPTLVVGYSVKARGIAKDIFGTEENYVIPVQSLTNEDELTRGFQWLMENEERIRGRYAAFMPEYIGRLSSVQELISSWQ